MLSWPDGIPLKSIPSDSVKRLSFGIRYPIQTSSSSWVFSLTWNGLNLPRCQSGWYTVTLWSTSGRTPRIGWSLWVSQIFRFGYFLNNPLLTSMIVMRCSGRAGVPSWRQPHPWEPQRGSCLAITRRVCGCLIPSQANILITNDTPPKACLADFGFTTMVLDPQNPMSSIFTLEGGTLTFMAPELLAPTRYGLKNAVPTKEGDIYAFGLVILQVAVSCRRNLAVFLTICQVLTGEQPFRGIRPLEIPFHILSGIRPAKPENAEAVGISEPLWNLIQKCWDSDKTRRPKIREVVTGVTDAAANWHELTPPSVMEPVEGTDGEDSDDLAQGEFLLFAIVPPVFRPSVQSQDSGLMRARVRTCQLLARVPAFRNPTIGPPSQVDTLR